MLTRGGVEEERITQNGSVPTKLQQNLPLCSESVIVSLLCIIRPSESTEFSIVKGPPDIIDLLCLVHVIFVLADEIH